MNCHDAYYRSLPPEVLSRRWFLKQCGVGLGSIAFSNLLNENIQAAPSAVDPLLPKQPHYQPKAKNVIFLFMAGAPSHLELFDNKPQLTKFDGTMPPAELLDGYRARFYRSRCQAIRPQI